MRGGIKADTTLLKPYLPQATEYVELTEYRILPSLDGSRLISLSQNVFTEGSDPAFTELDLDTPCDPTVESLVALGRIVHDGTLNEIFASCSVGSSLRELALTQHQFVEFFGCYGGSRSMLGLLSHRGRDDLFVCFAQRFDFGKYRAYHYQLDSEVVWQACDKLEIVLPTPYKRPK